MGETGLLAICVAALVSVFLLLALLAGAIRLITVVFPDRSEGRIDPALLAALAATVAVVSPEARLTRIVEET